MALDFSSLKKSRNDDLAKLNEQLKKLNPTGESKADERFWVPEVDKMGNGYAVIRFLPAPKNEDVPFVRIWSHGFKGPTGQWYIENSLTTLGKEDPVGEYNSKLWNSTTDEKSPARKQAREQKRKLNYISNIYVVKDPSHPENEGKVFLFKYGKKIFDKINEANNPQFADEHPLNPFDLWSGANFKIKIRNVEGYRNYDKSEFDTRGALFDDDDELKAVWDKEYSLTSFLDEKNFKDYDTLKRRLNAVLGLTAKATAEAVEDLPRKEAPKIKSQPSPEEESIADDDDEDLSYFKKLASE